MIVLILSGCDKKERAVDLLTELMCDCAVPVLEWRDKLRSEPALLEKGGEVEKQLRDCLMAEQAVFAPYQNDTSFIYRLADRMNESCPDANTTVNAMLLILAGEK